jgi:hypothetical protein
MKVKNPEYERLHDEWYQLATSASYLSNYVSREEYNEAWDRVAQAKSAMDSVPEYLDE